MRCQDFEMIFVLVWVLAKFSFAQNNLESFAK